MFIIVIKRYYIFKIEKCQKMICKLIIDLYFFFRYSDRRSITEKLENSASIGCYDSHENNSSHQGKPIFKIKRFEMNLLKSLINDLLLL